MTPLEAALLGIVQGLTEFLPISSSAHLILARAVLGWELPPGLAVPFDVACHLGTLAAVVVCYRRDVAALTRAAVDPGTWTGWAAARADGTDGADSTDDGPDGSRPADAAHGAAGRADGTHDADRTDGTHGTDGTGRADGVAGADEAVPADQADPAADAAGTAALARSLALATVPIGVVGLAAAEAVTGALRTPAVAGSALAVGAVAMLAAERTGARTRGETTLGPWEALGLGMAQAAALVPGVSRSGAVIVVAMLLGVRRERAARFAFLLGMPAILAAGAAAALDLGGQPLPDGAAAALLIGAASAAGCGYVTVTCFIRYVARHSLDPFAAYRIVLGGLALAWAAAA